MISHEYACKRKKIARFVFSCSRLTTCILYEFPGLLTNDQSEIADISVEGFHTCAGVYCNGRMAQYLTGKHAEQLFGGIPGRCNPVQRGQIPSQKWCFFNQHHFNTAIRHVFGRPKAGNAATDHCGMFFCVYPNRLQRDQLLGFGCGHGYEPRGFFSCLISVMHPTNLLADICMFINIGIGPGPGNGVSKSCLMQAGGA